MELEVVAANSHSNQSNLNKLFLYAIDASSGDCILLHCPNENLKVLIDSGPSKGKGRINVEKSLKKILSDDNRIDLAIVTHNDDDHIGGYSSLIEKKIIAIDTFIFNDSSYLCSLFSNSDGKYSLRQARELKNALEKNGIGIKTFCNKNNCIELAHYEFKGAFFQFLSPNEEKLKRYHVAIVNEKEENNLRIKYSLKKEAEITHELFEKVKQELSKTDYFIEDDKPANGTSLAFRLTIGCRNFLFLGDSHPSVVCAALKKLECFKFDLCKLSHHGSEKNTSQELLSIINCSNFLICSNGENFHNHPSIKTFARVLKNKPSSKFFFSSNSNAIQKIANITAIDAEFPGETFLKLEYEL